MNRPALVAPLLAALLLAPALAGAAPRSLKFDTYEAGSPWELGILDGLTLSEAPPATLGDTLSFGAFTFAGYRDVYDYEPVPGQTAVYSASRRNRSCDRAEDVAGAGPYFSYPDITALLGAGETVDVGRCTFFDQTTLDSLFTATGATAFQWTFFFFDDAVIAGLYGPTDRQSDGTVAFLEIRDDTTFLRDERDGTLVGGLTGNFSENYLCFSRDGSTFNGLFGAGDLAECRAPVSEVPLPGTLGLLLAGLAGLGFARRRQAA